MKKHWRSSSNDPIMLSLLNKKCQGGHCHAECRGRDCKVSEDYTPAIIDAIHAGFLQSCGPSDEWLVGERNDGIPRAVETGLVAADSHNVFIGEIITLSTPTNSPTGIPRRSRFTLGHSGTTRVLLSDIAITTYGTTAGFANHAPSPLLSCGYVSDLRSGDVERDEDVRRSSPLRGKYVQDEDHVGTSDCLSCISEVSAIDEVQSPDETYERIDDEITGWSPQGLVEENLGDDYSYYYHRCNSCARDGGTIRDLGTHDDVEEYHDCFSANDDDPPDDPSDHHDVLTNIDRPIYQYSAVRRNRDFATPPQSPGQCCMCVCRHFH
jgi:hypothetical protein